MRIFLTFLLFLLTTALYAQTINSIKYDGMVHISEPVALRMLDFEVGENVSVKMIDKAIKNYFKQGYFNDIWAEIDDEVLTFYFKEKPIISQVELSGWKENDEEAKDAIVQIKKGSLYNEKKLEAAKKRIIDSISQEGKIDSVVEIEKEYLDNGSIKITFLVNEGNEIIINKMEYSGVKGLKSDEFDSVISNKKRESFGWLWGRNDGEMNLPDLQYDNLRIRDYYMQNGYLDAKVEAPFVRVDFNSYTAAMSYEIEEGDAYTISKISLNQITKVVDEEKIREIMKLKVGEVFNIKTFREDSERIKTMIADLSYAFVQIVPDLRKNREDDTVEVVFRITPGDKVRIRNVIISGNNRTLDRIARRELYLGPGDMYSLTDLKDSRNSIGRLGYFDSNTIEEKRVDNQTIDLIVKVKEAPTGNIQLGGGYGSYGGILVSVGVSDRNIWGSGINMGIQAEKSETTENYSFNVSNPRLNDSDFSGNFSIFRSMYEYNDYRVYSDGITLGAGHRFSRHISGYIGYGYSKNSYDYDETLDLSTVDTFYFEEYAKSGLTISMKFDNTDDFYLPREGFTFSQSFEKTGLGGDAEYFKSRSSFGKFIGLQEYVDFDAIFRYKARYNTVLDNGYVPIGEKFYMGGIGSVRGYQSYSISPTVIRGGDVKRIGGNQTFSNSLELSLPLLPEAKMRLVTYLDWGFIGDESLREYSRGGYGAGLEWFSPVGPIQLMFSNPLNVHEGDKISHFEFTMGQRF